MVTKNQPYLLSVVIFALLLLSLLWASSFVYAETGVSGTVSEAIGAIVNGDGLGMGAGTSAGDWLSSGALGTDLAVGANKVNASAVAGASATRDIFGEEQPLFFALIIFLAGALYFLHGKPSRLEM